MSEVLGYGLLALSAAAYCVLVAREIRAVNRRSTLKGWFLRHELYAVAVGGCASPLIETSTALGAVRAVQAKNDTSPDGEMVRASAPPGGMANGATPGGKPGERNETDPWRSRRTR